MRDVTANEKRGSLILLAIAGANLLFHLLIANRYGIFRDELYYLACSEHLDAGYVDQPPLIAFIAWIARHLFGESLLGLRFLPALAGRGDGLVNRKTCARLGGGAFAQAARSSGRPSPRPCFSSCITGSR